MKVKCIIVDDEELALDILEEFIRRIDFLQLEGRCRNALEAINILAKKQVDLIFLDIQMPGLTGLQMLRNLSNLPPVIITTAYPNYAIEGFELEVLDYLLKPIPFERFLKSVNRFFAVHTQPAATVLPPQPAEEPFIFVKADKRMIKIPLAGILYLESTRNYVIIQLADGSQVKTLSTISHIEEKLPDADFVRIHRSFIVAVKRIKAYTQGSLQVGEKYLPLGRNYKQVVLGVLNRGKIL
jgi:DNA-binding LytR/AlgR family response regulator